MTWVYLLSPALDRAYLAVADDHTLAVIEAHGDHLESLQRSGQLVLAGRCWDGPYGVVIFNAVDRESAEAVVAADPTVVNGVQRADLYEFNMPYPRGRARSRPICPRRAEPVARTPARPEPAQPGHPS